MKWGQGAFLLNPPLPPFHCLEVSTPAPFVPTPICGAPTPSRVPSWASLVGQEIQPKEPQKRDPPLPASGPAPCFPQWRPQRQGTEEASEGPSSDAASQTPGRRGRLPLALEAPFTQVRGRGTVGAGCGARHSQPALLLPRAVPLQPPLDPWERIVPDARGMGASPAAAAWKRPDGQGGGVQRLPRPSLITPTCRCPPFKRGRGPNGSAST